MTLATISSDFPNSVYLMGLSDFFGTIFEDLDIIQGTMAAHSHIAGDIYDQFLTLSSGLSLSELRQISGGDFKLVVLKDSDLVSGTTYRIDSPLIDCGFAVSSPLLPGVILESGVDFELEQQDSGSAYITFSRSLSSYGFSKRSTSTGEEHALWLTEIVLDNGMLRKEYGRFVKYVPSTFSEYSANITAGLYSLYCNGPSIQTLERSLGLYLGIPTARATEEVLDVRYYLGTDQCIVITTGNQYLLPKNVTPKVGPGMTLEKGESLADTFHIIDDSVRPYWWREVLIPSYIIPSLPVVQGTRLAAEGTLFDDLMDKVLKRNTFLVELDDNLASLIPDISEFYKALSRSRPSYTSPILMWNSSGEVEDFLKSMVDYDFSVVTLPATTSNLRQINGQSINSTPI